MDGREFYDVRALVRPTSIEGRMITEANTVIELSRQLKRHADDMLMLKSKYEHALRAAERKLALAEHERGEMIRLQNECFACRLRAFAGDVLTAAVFGGFGLLQSVASALNDRSVGGDRT